MKNPVGRVLLGQYRIDAFVASGGMGAVYRVWDIKRNVHLAMKVLHAELAEDPSVLKRFHREANALKNLTHPNIVPFYGIYESHGFSFLLELYIDGPTLKEILSLEKGRPLPVREALIFLKALGAALGYAHVHGAVHCDVKPGNVMIDRGGNIYLTDFGIVRHADSSTTTLATIGTAAYMAPEQVRGEAVSPATDAYALGVMLFEMLTGQRPFSGTESDSEMGGTTAAERIRYAHLHLAPPDPRKLNHGISEGLASVVLKALAKDQQARYQDVNQLLVDATFAAGLGQEQIPNRINLDNYPDARDIWEAPTERDTEQAAVYGGESKQLPVYAGVAAPKPKTGWIAVVAGAVLIAVVIGGAIVYDLLAPTDGSTLQGENLATRTQSKAVSGVAASPTLESINTARPIQTTYKPPTTIQTSPIATNKQNTSPPIIPTRTIQLPTNTPKPTYPQFTASQDMFCRDGPGTSYEMHVTIIEGQSLPVLRRWNEGNWLLVGINRTDTRTKCCWIGGQGSLNVNLQNIPVINFLPDRVRCELD